MWVVDEAGGPHATLLCALGEDLLPLCIVGAPLTYGPRQAGARRNRKRQDHTTSETEYIPVSPLHRIGFIERFLEG